MMHPEDERKEDIGPFGPPPKEYKYRCSKCGFETLVNEAVIDAGIAWAEIDGYYYEGYMPKLGCSKCNQETLEYVDESPPEGR